tara:strand:- start:681 stop:1079 length:399 start_codon:yes stop_codon:yes gene_type:complete
MIRNLVFLLALFGVIFPSQGADQPNVVFIMADDLRTQLFCYGGTEVKKPRLDAFAEKSFRPNRDCVQSAVRRIDFRSMGWRNTAGAIVAREPYGHQEGSFLEAKSVLGQEIYRIDVAELRYQLHEQVPHDTK